ncbi:hypothetical protein CVT26_002875 [Gymnopilus dilepis]|uniref:Uncharacterized protein n=1 Tax=Gymnopilus dilepis TaxID=231916 RepID=A0A409VT57_9AGAR|nr:hypothetical protein CVT26_002875 [Gymnopilus dilepis]
MFSATCLRGQCGRFWKGLDGARDSDEEMEGKTMRRLSSHQRGAGLWESWAGRGEADERTRFRSEKA